MRLKSLLAKRITNKKSFSVSMLLILLILIMASVQYTEAKELSRRKQSEIAQTKTEVLQEDKKIEEQLAPVPVEANAPAPAVAVNTPAPKAPAKTAVKPKSSTTATKPAAQRRTATTAPATSNQLSTAMNASGIISQINYQRRANGLGNTSLNSLLSAAALAKARHMADNNYFAHTAPDGTGDFYFVNGSGYSWTSAGVNLAMGDFGDAKGLVDAWMNSEGHKKNILASYGKVLGVGIYGKYFVMIIAN